METVFDRLMQAAQDLAPEHQMTKARLKVIIGESAQTITNWQKRGVPTAKITSLARMVKVLPDWLETGTGPKTLGDFGPAIETPLRPVVVVDSPDDIQHEIIEVPRYTVKASAGNGSPILDVDTEGTPNYCRSSWAHSHGYSPKNLFSIVATGDSMEPTIPEGASLIVHRQHDVVNGKVHIICRRDECFVKRLYKQMDEALLIHSDNEKKYSSITVRKDDPDQVHVVGLVVSMSTNL